MARAARTHVEGTLVNVHTRWCGCGSNSGCPRMNIVRPTLLCPVGMFSR